MDNVVSDLYLKESSRESLFTTQELLNDNSKSFLRELTSPEHANLDLVAIHGLNPAGHAGFAAKTWTAGDKGKEKLWLKDFLPYRLPNVRVLLYSYNSSVAFQSSKIGIGDIAEDLLLRLKSMRKNDPDRPLLFVCHSLGGIVTKRAITKAKMLSKYYSISQATRAFAFFATPHRGGFQAAAGSVAAGIVRRVVMSPKNGIMEVLKKDSFAAADFNNDFIDGLEEFKIVSFYECMPMAPFGQLIVEKSSAVLGLGSQEARVPCVNATHSSICKFATEGEDYRFVIDEIEELVKWSLASALKRVASKDLIDQHVADAGQSRLVPVNSYGSSSTNSLKEPETSHSAFGDLARLKSNDSSISIFTEPLPKPSLMDTTSSINDALNLHAPPPYTATRSFFLVPYSRNLNFVGRDTILHTVKQLFSSSNEINGRAALFGLAGIGKSAVALEVAHWYHLNYPRHSVFWINASSIDLIFESFQQMAAHCRIPGPRHTRDMVLNSVRSWLSSYTSSRWLLVFDGIESAESLLNPRSSDWQGKYITDSLPVSFLFTTNDMSVGKVLVSRSHLVKVASMNEQDASKLLQNHLWKDDMQTGHFKSKEELWHDGELESLAKHLDCIPMALVQAATFMRNEFLPVKNYLALLRNDQTFLVDLLEYEAQEITARGERFYAQLNEGRPSTAVVLTLEVMFASVEAQSKEAADLLSVIAFLEPQSIPPYFFHNLVGDRWKNVSQSLRTLQAYSLINESSEYSSFSMHRIVQLGMRRKLVKRGTEISWATEALEQISSIFPNATFESWASCAALMPHALKIINCNLFGPMEAVPLGRLQAKLSLYALSQGELTESESWSYLALGNLDHHPEISQEEILAIKWNRIVDLQHTGNTQEAEDLAQEVWRARRSVLGVKHLDTLQSAETLSIIYRAQGKYSEAVKVMQKTLKSLEGVLGPDDLQVLTAKKRLGAALQQLGQPETAESFVRESVEGFKRTLGPKNPETLKSKWRLAWVIHNLGRYDEAEIIIVEVLSAQKEILRQDHPDTLKTRFVFGKILLSQSKFDEAMSQLREVHRLSTQHVGATHAWSLIVASTLASCLLASGTKGSQVSPQILKEAKELSLFVVVSRESCFRPDHPDTIAARTALATVLRLRGELYDAEILERETLKRLKKSKVNKEHHLVIRSRDSLSRTLWAQSDVDSAKGKEAIGQASKVLKMREKELGWAHPDTRDSAQLMVEILPEGKERRTISQKLQKK